jgi:hypothetical protein
VRAAFGDVAVTVDPECADDFSRPHSGWLAGLGVGTARGVWATVALAMIGTAYGSESGRDGAAVLGGFFGFVVGAAVGVLYTPVSMVAGAVTAPDRGETQRAEAAIRPITADPGLPAAFAGAFSANAGRPLVAPEEAATLVELSLESVGGGSTWNWLTLDRPFEVVVEASARVVRRSDRAVLWSARRRVPGPGDEPRRRTFVEWSANDAWLLREEVHRAIDRLGSGFAWSIFHQQPGEPLPRPVKEADL